jgi:hypothetical protein
MGFIDSQTIAVGLVTIHLAVCGCTTESVPSSAHDKSLRLINEIVGAAILHRLVLPVAAPVR